MSSASKNTAIMIHEDGILKRVETWSPLSKHADEAPEAGGGGST